jgi:UDP-N-acetylglucosamine 2-epimerase (non-hydrolysing)
VPAQIIVVAGARPNFMKVAPILASLARSDMSHALVHTGQHYDASMSDAFFRDLEMAPPRWHLGVGSGTHAVQTARVMEAFEPVLAEEQPRWVVVVGDVNSTLACALVASKMPGGIQVAHVEAGLRSNDWSMPEEVNRVLTDRLSDLLLTPSPDAKANLLREGIDPSRIVFVGNVMIDTLLWLLPRARALGMAAQVGVEPGRFAVSTLHRPSNVDNAERLSVILRALGRLAERLPVVLSVHPRTRSRLAEFGLASLLDPLVVRDPLGYKEMLGLQDAAALVVTDSGGLQEETTVLGVPCLTVRESTERPVTVTHGTNTMAPWPPTEDSLFQAAVAALERGRLPVGARAPEGWDGRASERIVDALRERS